MSERHTILVIDDDPEIRSALELLLDRDGRTIILCADVESAELVLEHHPVTHVLSDVQFSGSFGFEGLHFLTHIRLRRPSCRIVLMSGYFNEEMCSVAKQFGAAAVLAKPFELRELEDALRIEGGGTGPYVALHVPSLDELLRERLLVTEYQPIVSLDPLMVAGFEALTRVQGSWAGGNIAELFDYASKRQRLAELNLAALESAVAQGRRLPGETALFLNVDPLTFDREDVVDALRTAASRNAFPLSRVVIEITERSGFSDHTKAISAVDRLRAEGVRFALDDHGSAYSHLSLIDHIRPSFIKISHTFGTAFEEDPMRTRVVRHIAALARDFECRTILEGIESASTACAAVAHGIDHAQGYYFGRPREASHWSDAARAAA